MNKRLKNKLKHRNIDISGYKPKMTAIRTDAHLDYFTKADLDDQGEYELDIEEDYYGDASYPKLYHNVKRLETQEELGERLCKEYDEAKAQKEFEDKKKQQLIKDAKKLGMKFK